MNKQFEYELIYEDYGEAWAGHKKFAYDLIRNIQPSMVVELGTHKGTSLFSMCQAAKDAKLDTAFFAVDTWKGDEHSGLYGEDVFELVNKIKDNFYPTVELKLMRMTFDEAQKGFEEGWIDLLHIDGLHTYEAVKHDFECWLPKVRDDGIILMHDIHEHQEGFGVDKLWEEIKQKYKTLEFEHSHGLGIVFKNWDKYSELFNFELI